jgi:predicted amidophosphoribosyltransferase
MSETPSAPRLCPKCGFLVATKDGRCAACGSSFITEKPAAETASSHCPMCGAAITGPLALRCAACGEELAPVKISEPWPLWKKILVAVGIIIGVQWALIVLLFAICLLG